jgi:hypothetical protein
VDDGNDPGADLVHCDHPASQGILAEMSSARVYVGNLPDDVRRSEVEDLFAKYGRIRDIDIKMGRARTWQLMMGWLLLCVGWPKA